MRNIDFASLKAQIDQLSHKGNKKQSVDTRFWNLTFPEGSNRASAIIRFLPPKKGDANYIVPQKSHYFRYATPTEGQKTYFEMCPKTIGQRCPVCDYAFNHKEDRGKLPNDSFITNILVIKDPNNPDTEGKVFLYRFKRDVWKKIQQAVSPEDESIDQPMNIFDVSNAPNLKLVGVKKAAHGFSKLVLRCEESTWTAPTPIVIKGETMSEEFLDGLEDKVYGLDEFIAPDKFKSYDDIKARFDVANNTLSEIPETEGSAEEPKAEEPKANKSDSNNFVKAPDTVGDDFFDTI